MRASARSASGPTDGPQQPAGAIPGLIVRVPRPPRDRRGLPSDRTRDLLLEAQPSTVGSQDLPVSLEQLEGLAQPLVVDAQALA